MIRSVISLLILGAFCFACDAKPRGGTQVPSPAFLAGYTINTFHAGPSGPINSTNTPFSTATVDQNLTYVDGFQWYYYNFFGQSPITPSLNTFNADGTITLGGGFPSALATAGQTAGTPPFVGIAFGCGAYFTAELSFSNQIAIGGNNIVPSFYSFSLEHLVYPPGAPQQTWAGQTPPYDHFIEIDFLEYNRNQLVSPFSFGSEVHEYWGPSFGGLCPPADTGGGYCWLSLTVAGSGLVVPKQTDNTKYHRFAKLWIPATVSTQGSLTTYFDDIPLPNGNAGIDQIFYTQFTGQAPPPGVPLYYDPGGTSQPWAFGVVDIQHQVPILLAGAAKPGSTNPAGNTMTVRSVDVWQNSSACNLTN